VATWRRLNSAALPFADGDRDDLCGRDPIRVARVPVLSPMFDAPNATRWNRLMRLRLRTLLLVVAAFIAGQSIVTVTDSTEFWPFSPVAVYMRFPSDLKGNSTNVVVVTPDGEVDAVRFGNTSYRMIRKLNQRLKNAKSEEQARAALLPLLAYVRAEGPGGSRVEGVRVYALEWDLAAGRVVGSKLLHEHLEP